jgi:hypothetical protein
VDIARRKDAIHGGRRRQSIAGLEGDVSPVHFKLPPQEVRSGFVPDSKEKALDLEVRRLSRLDSPDPDAFDL